MWDVQYTNEIGGWLEQLTKDETCDVFAVIGLLEMHGPNLRHPFSSGINASKHSHMRELRIQHKGKPYRILYAFDPERSAILLIGGDKTGDKRWYKKNIPIADKLYKKHLQGLGDNHGQLI